MSRILGLDYGEKRVGLAITDPLNIIAKPLQTINVSKEDIYKVLNQLIKEYQIVKIVVGLPLTLKNTHSIQTDKVLVFIEQLKNNINIDIDTYDERFTSDMAKDALIKQGIKTGHNKSEIDKTAAAIFLQNYIDAK